MLQLGLILTDFGFQDGNILYGRLHVPAGTNGGKARCQYPLAEVVIVLFESTAQGQDLLGEASGFFLALSSLTFTAYQMIPAFLKSFFIVFKVLRQLGQTAAEFLGIAIGLGQFRFQMP